MMIDFGYVLTLEIVFTPSDGKMILKLKLEDVKFVSSSHFYQDMVVELSFTNAIYFIN